MHHTVHETSQSSSTSYTFLKPLPHANPLTYPFPFGECVETTKFYLHSDLMCDIFYNSDFLDLGK